MAERFKAIRTVKSWKDIGYTAVLRGETSVISDAIALVDFKAYRIMSEGYTSGPPGMLYERAGSTESGDLVIGLSDARVFMSGEVKLDGCSNIRFDEQDECMLHFCGAKQAANVGVLLGRLYAECGKMMPGSLITVELSVLEDGREGGGE